MEVMHYYGLKWLQCYNLVRLKKDLYISKSKKTINPFKSKTGPIINEDGLTYLTKNLEITFDTYYSFTLALLLLGQMSTKIKKVRV